jgi:hypothetical protein
MMPRAYPQEIDLAFAGNPDLRKRVHAAIGEPHAPISYVRQ